LPRPALALEVDALGRFLFYGLATGEITRLDLDGSGRTRGAAPDAISATPRAGAVRAPDWTIPVAQTDDQAETAVLGVRDDPGRIGVAPSRKRMEIFTLTGGALGQAPEIYGVGRIIRTAPGWMAAATDRMVILYDARRNTTQKLDISLVEITHLVIRP